MLLMLCACGRSLAQSAAEPAQRTPVLPPRTADEDKLPWCPPLERPGDAGAPPTREQAVAFAEEFVRVAGYTDAGATCLASESVFGVDLALRRGSLQPKAYAIKKYPSGWAVVFLKSSQRSARGRDDASPDGPELGRAVLIDDQTGEAAVAHKEAILKFFDRLAP
jgi:hypothetical protein